MGCTGGQIFKFQGSNSPGLVRVEGGEWVHELLPLTVPNVAHSCILVVEGDRPRHLTVYDIESNQPLKQFQFHELLSGRSLVQILRMPVQPSTYSSSSSSSSSSISSSSAPISSSAHFLMSVNVDDGGYCDVLDMFASKPEKRIAQAEVGSSVIRIEVISPQHFIVATWDGYLSTLR